MFRDILTSRCHMSLVFHASTRLWSSGVSVCHKKGKKVPIPHANKIPLALPRAILPFCQTAIPQQVMPRLCLKRSLQDSAGLPVGQKFGRFFSVFFQFFFTGKILRKNKRLLRKTENTCAL